eukprot:scaffold193485_cov32-Tisochrysis_lutea.AAC.7
MSRSTSPTASEENGERKKQPLDHGLTLATVEEHAPQNVLGTVPWVKIRDAIRECLERIGYRKWANLLPLGVAVASTNRGTGRHREVDMYSAHKRGVSYA